MNTQHSPPVGLKTFSVFFISMNGGTLATLFLCYAFALLGALTEAVHSLNEQCWVYTVYTQTMEMWIAVEEWPEN